MKPGNDTPEIRVLNKPQLSEAVTYDGEMDEQEPAACSRFQDS